MRGNLTTALRRSLFEGTGIGGLLIASMTKERKDLLGYEPRNH
jgi:hypothetical protein